MEGRKEGNIEWPTPKSVCSWAFSLALSIPHTLLLLLSIREVSVARGELSRPRGQGKTRDRKRKKRKKN